MRAFTDQVAVVTGASSGIGKAIALGLAKEGATLCLLGRNLETLEAVAQNARTTAPRVLSYQADLTLDKDIEELGAHLQRDFGNVDILIHSAGVISLGPFETAPVENLDRQYRINFRAPYMLTKLLLPRLRIRRGQIVFINSSAGLNAKANVGIYAAMKHALKAFADSLREEVNSEGVRVLSVFVGRTATPMQEFVHKIEERQYRPERLLQPEDIASAVISALSLERTAELTDLHIRPLETT